jgi:glycosyltransferase involved in cell wall biosynthesis
MNKNLPVSVVISAYNEEKKLGDCLASVSWADEVIVIDNESTDRTVEIAKKFDAVILTRPNNLMLNVNKNYGFTKAKHEWILSLDADEQVTSELAEEIKDILVGGRHSGSGLNDSEGARLLDKRGSDESRTQSYTDSGQARMTDYDGFWIPRRNIIFGKWIKHTGWYPDYVLRLFKKDKGRFEEKHVHEMIKLEGEAGHLKQDIIHYNYETIAQFLRKTIVIYAPNEAANKVRSGYKIKFRDAFRFPLDEFLSRYFAREGYKDGFHGLMLSLLMAMYHFIVFANIWEMKNFKQLEEKDFLISAEQEIGKGYKDTMYWIYTEKIKATKNGLKKTVFKVLRKV